MSSYDVESVEVMPLQDTSVMAMQHKSEIEAMVDTAHKYPRSIKTFEADALTMATIDAETAQSMFYTVPRGGKHIIGPSVRLAEIMATAWGNLRFGARIVSIDHEFVTAQGFCFDLQKNTGATEEVKRRITNKKGERFNEDMIQVTCNAACSLARRNAIVRVIPRVYVDKVFAASRDVAIGKGESMDSRRSRAMEGLKKFGLTEERVLATINKPSAKDMDVDDLATLYALVQSVKNGDKTLEEAFPEPESTPDAEPKKPSSKGAAAKTKEKLGIKDPAPAKAEPVTIPPLGSDEAAEAIAQLSESKMKEYDEKVKAALAEGMSREDAHETAYAAVAL